MGPGSRFQPIKAAVVMDDSDEEEKTGEINIREDSLFKFRQTDNMSMFIQDVVEELDEIIDIDKEQQELNQMFMDEDKLL